MQKKRLIGQIQVRCTHCRTVLVHDWQDRRPCRECGSQMAIYRGVPILIARNADDGVPLKKLDPKKKKILIPPN